jgi:hypothetical protein
MSNVIIYFLTVVGCAMAAMYSTTVTVLWLPILFGLTSLFALVVLGRRLTMMQRVWVASDLVLMAYAILAYNHALPLVVSVFTAYYIVMALLNFFRGVVALSET